MIKKTLRGGDIANCTSALYSKDIFRRTIILNTIVSCLKTIILGLNDGASRLDVCLIFISTFGQQNTSRYRFCQTIYLRALNFYLSDMVCHHFKATP